MSSSPKDPRSNDAAPPSEDPPLSEGAPSSDGVASELGDTELPPPVSEIEPPKAPPAARPAVLPAPLEDEEGLSGTVIADRYLVHRRIGLGGMGTVYEAEHIHMKKRVALKILHSDMSRSEEVVARFEREAVAAGRIRHPSVVTATDFGQLPDGVFYLVLEYVDGRSLADVMREEGPLSPERALSILHQVNAALGAAHRAGVVHRDLKPDNVMLVDTGDDEDFVKVLDFGIAKLHLDDTTGQKSLTKMGVVFGTPEYMAPEQARGDLVDHRSDLYALGMIGYEMLAGRSAFKSDDLMAMLTAQIVDAPPPLPESLPSELSQLILRLLEKEPDQRPATAEETAEALTAIATQFNWPLPQARTSAGTRTMSSFGAKQRADVFGHLPGVPDQVTVRPFDKLRSLSMHPVSIGPRAVPLWIPVVGLLVGLSLGAVAMLHSRSEFEEEESGAAAPVDSGEDRLLASARGGEREALAELRRVVEEERDRAKKTGKQPTAEEQTRDVARFMALGRGYSALRHHSAAMDAYQRAVVVDPHSAEDPDLLADVRVALEQRDAVESGLDFAKEHLGAPGADMVYDLYRDYLGKPGMTPVVARAQKLVKDPSLRERASPALRVALDLERAKTCGEYREVVLRAEKDVDERSLYKLEALRVRKGCGPGAAKDCFLCLRSPEVPLEPAIEAAKKRPAPALLSGATTRGQ